MNFSKSFSSEALLQQAIAGLLMRLPDVSGVQISQGAQELGKDIVFNIRGGFGESVLCACIVKNSRITGDVAKPGGACTVYFQAEQVFDSAHIEWLIGEIRQLQSRRNITLAPAYFNDIFARLLEAFPEYPLEQFAVQLNPIKSHITESSLRERKEEISADMKILDGL